MDDEIRVWIDKAAILEVQYKNARALDRCDWELLRSCFHEDAVDEHGSHRGTREEYIEWVKPIQERFAATTHYIVNHLCEVDGNVAWSETYGHTYHRTHPTEHRPASDYVVHVRYCDRLERRADRVWRIAHRVCAYEPGRSDPILYSVVPDEGSLGRRDRTDPSYRRA